MSNFFTLTARGSCKPSDKATLFVFKTIQMQANRFLDSAGETLLTCDGIIGSKTLAAVNSVGTKFPVSGVLGAPAASCQDIANNPTQYSIALKTVADQHKLSTPECPRGIIRKITSPEPVVSSDGKVSYESSNILGFPWWAWALLGGGGGAYWYHQKYNKGVQKPFKWF